ncbi:hypothetical protein V2O64_11160 [Verrucomicrobiaceae bacterium 227]
MKKKTNLTCLLAAGVTFGALADETRPGLDHEREYTSDSVDYKVTYSDTAGDSDRISASDVDDLEDFTSSSYDRLVDVMGFRSPWLSTLPDYEFIVKDDWWYAEPACVVLDAPSIRNWPTDDSRVVFFHERFHTVQRNYKDSINGGGSGYIGSTFGKLVSEGTADAVMDKGYADLDDNTGFPYYEGSAANFLQSSINGDGDRVNGPKETLFDKDYDGCLWWNYLMEQLGTTHVEPHYGIDFMVNFWNRLVSNGNTGSANSKATMEQAIASRGRTLQGMFHDFTICNYAREFDTTGLSDGAKYRYVDEQSQAITVNVEKDTTSIPSSGSNTVNPWAANYIEATLDSNDECLAAGFKVETTGDTMAFAAVAVDRTGKVIGIKKAIGTEFAGVFFSEAGRPIERICGVVAGLEQGGTAEWSFGAGVPKLDIIRPTFSRPAYPGPAAEPETIVVTTRVTGIPDLAPDGPNTPSILGLEPEYFGVTIGTLNAPVLDAAYVGGFWELVVAAPVQAADGFYDLTVDLCPDDSGRVTANLKNAVLYGDLTFHHAIVLDISGSMTFPTDAKLIAAKQAAKFYIDAIGTQDKFTVVSFSGDGAECNEDASNLKGSPGLVDSTAFSRGLLKLAVDNLNSQSLTSIGDGIWEAQNALDLESSPNAIDTILLLTDGKENESRYWASDPDGCGQVSTRIAGTETIINTRAFGENAETDLCQAIAAATAGDYLFNPVDEGTSARARSATSDFESLNNQLSLRFLGGLEHSKRLQRLALEKVKVPGADGFKETLLQPYDKVTQPIIYIGWSENTSVTFTILDPHGNDVSGDAVVHQDDTHVVFHPNNPLIQGDYTFEFKEIDGNDVEVFYGFSGKPGNNLNFQCDLSPVKTGGLNGRSEHPYELFEQGMPVDITLAGFDLGGPLRDLEVTVEVILPDGTPACKDPLQMFDDAAHQDGNFRDGRFGVRYTRTPFAASYIGKQNDRDEKAKAEIGSSGTYRVFIRARGKDNFGNKIDRVFEKAFQVFRRFETGNGKGDTDDDGMTDSWERFYGTNPLVNDADKDPDEDGLKNIEEFQQGTHPLDPDSDDGGAADGYEVANDLCPICPSDDPFPSLANVSVITSSDSHGDVGLLRSNALLLNFPDNPNYGAMEIYRGLAPGFPCNAASLLDVVDMTGPNLVTSYYDEGLTDGTRYYYKFRARSLDGQLGTPISRDVSGIARQKPAEPFGSIVLNSGLNRTDRTRIAVKLLHRGSGEQYRLSNTAFDGSEPWLPLPAFGTIVPFDLPATLNHGDTGRVFFQFRSGSLVTSRTYFSDIEIDFNSNSDNNGSNDGTDPDDDNDGVSDEDELFLYCTNPYSKDTDGDGYSDLEEINNGTDPTDFASTLDTDGDSYPDKLEILLGSEPNDAASVPDINYTVTPVTEASEMATVAFNTVTGVIYRVHNRDNLGSRIRDWNKVISPVIGDGTRKSYTVPVDLEREFFSVSYELAPLN